ncbi:hypothetical protein LguiA_027739 [Lonicera macranthoides]
MSWCKLATTCTSLPNLRIHKTISNDNRGVVEIRTPALQFASTGARKNQQGTCRITMRDRSSNRRPLQKGRNLSIEAIQTIQALKRANKNKMEEEQSSVLEQVFVSKFKRLLKLDMMAVLKELIRQNECFLALKAFRMREAGFFGGLMEASVDRRMKKEIVFEDVRKEHWYKPQLQLYAEIISVLGSNGLFDKVELLFKDLGMESNLEPDIKGFNALLESLMSFSIIGLTMECFYLMKSVGCDPDRQTFKILINGLESNGEASLSATVRQEAQKYYGESLDFLEEQDEIAVS